MGRRLNITIAPDGTVHAEVSGTPGPSCMDAIDDLTEMLGAQITDSRPTPEFSEPARVSQQSSVQNWERA